MLSEAVREIQVAAAQDQIRRRRQAAGKEELRRVDRWLGDIEGMLEEDRKTVPEPLVKEIAGFLRGIDPKLHRNLLRNRTREAARVLDILFDAQEHLLPGLEETA